MRPAALSVSTGIVASSVALRSVWGLACHVMVSFCSRKEISEEQQSSLSVNLLGGPLGDLRISAPRGRPCALQYPEVLGCLPSVILLIYTAPKCRPQRAPKRRKWQEKVVREECQVTTFGDVPPWDIRIKLLHGALGQDCWRVWGRLCGVVVVVLDRANISVLWNFFAC